MKRFFAVLVASLLVYGCGGGSSSNNVNTPPAISVSLSPSTQTSLDVGQTLALTATVTNDSSSKGATWTVSGTGCSGAACGTLTNTTTTTATYNTPASVTASLTVTVTATSASDTTKSAASTVVVNSAPSITTKSLSNGLVGTAYSATLAATGGTGTLTWTVASGSSSLPAGLSISNSGAISGTPTAAGPSTFTVKVTDGASTPVAVTQALSITIYSPLSISTSTLPNGAVGVFYNQTVAASGGTGAITWSWTSSTVPPGLQLGSSGASTTVSGTPTQAGPFTFTVTATDSSSPAQTAKETYTVTIAPPLSISTTSLPNGAVGAAYSQSLVATGGTGTLTWKLSTGTLPNPLALSSSGTISGNPNYPGISSFTVMVTDAGTPPQTKTQALSLTIDGAAGGPLSISTTSLPAGTVGVSYTGSITVKGGTPPFTYSVAPSIGGLPAGLSLNTATGEISGTPTVTGVSNFTVSVTDDSLPPLTAGPQFESITITNPASACGSSGNETVLSGQYAFTLNGFNGTGFLGVAGAFTADGTEKSPAARQIPMAFLASLRPPSIPHTVLTPWAGTTGGARPSPPPSVPSRRGSLWEPFPALPPPLPKATSSNSSLLPPRLTLRRGRFCNRIPPHSPPD